MLSIEVDSYRISLCPAQQYFNIPIQVPNPVIFLFDADGRFFVRINFMSKEDLGGVQAVNLDTLPWFHLSYPRDDYPFVLDLLRNEKPVFLQMESIDPQSVILTTLPEPIGEGEVSR